MEMGFFNRIFTAITFCPVCHISELFHLNQSYFKKQLEIGTAFSTESVLSRMRQCRFISNSSILLLSPAELYPSIVTPEQSANTRTILKLPRTAQEKPPRRGSVMAASTLFEVLLKAVTFHCHLVTYAR